MTQRVNLPTVRRNFEILHGQTSPNTRPRCVRTFFAQVPAGTSTSASLPTGPMSCNPHPKLGVPHITYPLARAHGCACNQSYGKVICVFHAVLLRTRLPYRSPHTTHVVSCANNATRTQLSPRLVGNCYVYFFSLFCPLYLTISLILSGSPWCAHLHHMPITLLSSLPVDWSFTHN
jgi:hypothetical protein